MYEQVDFHFRYQPGSESPYALLLKYLQPKKKSSKRDKGLPTEDLDESVELPRERMILWALSAFWYPSACKKLGRYSDVDLKQKARNAIYQLLQQIYYLIQMFELDPSEFVFPGSTGGLNNQLKVGDRAATPGIGNEKAITAISTSSRTTSGSKTQESLEPPTTLGLVRSEDDIALDEAFVD
ncbi:hypothetical protein C7B80_32370 [Cyanosarcina cf. burmensis CCALA 770]|nr:hypothetical protein C7B80_32370 [Cyanosarcina cf. burmensis CCALA 770]